MMYTPDFSRLLAPFLFIAIIGCGESNTDSIKSSRSPSGDTSQSNRYVIHREEKQTNDPSSPVGYWEVSKTYPMLADTLRNGTAINDEIEHLVDSFSCDGAGDESFASTSVHVDEYIFSMAYDAMWMCPTMASPDSASGAMNIRREDGKHISLEQEFVTGEAYSRFVNHAISEMNASLPEVCPRITDIGSFYIEPSHIAVSAPSLVHGNANCEVTVRLDRALFADMFKSESVLRIGKRN